MSSPRFGSGKKNEEVRKRSFARQSRCRAGRRAISGVRGTTSASFGRERFTRPAPRSSAATRAAPSAAATSSGAPAPAAASAAASAPLRPPPQPGGGVEVDARAAQPDARRGGAEAPGPRRGAPAGGAAPDLPDERAQTLPGSAGARGERAPAPADHRQRPGAARRRPRSAARGRARRRPRSGGCRGAAASRVEEDAEVRGDLLEAAGEHDRARAPCG